MFLRLRVVCAAILLLSGCGGEPSDGPLEIQYGLEECGYCRMIISEEKFATATVEEAGTAIPFDDVGCLLGFLHERSASPKSHAGDTQTERIWVHDHATGEWIAAEPAWFVRDPRGATPMGSGLVAFATRSAAKAFASDRAAAIVTWQELVTRTPVE